MKSVKTIFASVLWLCFLSGVAQSELLKKEWIIKSVSRDTLLLLNKAQANVDQYYSRPCEFQDTTYYGTFKPTGVMEINRVVRSCSKEGGKKLTQTSDRSTSSRDSILTEYESVDLHPKEISLSLWDKSQGKYTLKNTTILLIGTEKFDGRYRIKVVDSNSIELISAKQK
jgi:hypothetical protein